MLVLKRMRHERIKICTQPPIWIEVADLGKGWVRLAFDAAPEIVIMREELLDQTDVRK
jgi:sRNA-binding carbon storage regulator CsrA